MSTTNPHNTDDLDESREESLERLANSDLPIAEDAAQLLAALREERHQDPEDSS